MFYKILSFEYNKKNVEKINIYLIIFNKVILNEKTYLLSLQFKIVYII